MLNFGSNMNTFKKAFSADPNIALQQNLLSGSRPHKHDSRILFNFIHSLYRTNKIRVNLNL
jgi:hypothetical protein